MRSHIYEVQRVDNGGYIVRDPTGRTIIAASDYDRMRRDLRKLMEPSPLPKMKPAASTQTVSAPPQQEKGETDA